MWRIVRFFGGLLLVLILALVLLWIMAQPTPVPATVVDDTALPHRVVDGITLHYQEFGDPAAPRVIVVHGGPGGDHRSLLPLQALADNYHISFYDQRGSGLSERVAPGRLDLTGYLTELDQLVQANAPVHLIGHSWGAILAHAYMGQHPDNVASAVLIEPGFLNASEARQWQARSAELMSGPRYGFMALRNGMAASKVSGPDKAAAEDMLWGAMVDGFVNAATNPYHCPDAPYDSPAWRFGAKASQMSGKALPGDYQSIAKGEAFHGPILFMTGSCDDWIGTPLQRPRLPRYAQATLFEVPDAGHDVIDDQPHASIAAIRAFLDQTRGAQ